MYVCYLLASYLPKDILFLQPACMSNSYIYIYMLHASSRDVLLWVIADTICDQFSEGWIKGQGLQFKVFFPQAVWAH